MAVPLHVVGVQLIDCPPRALLPHLVAKKADNLAPECEDGSALVENLTGCRKGNANPRLFDISHLRQMVKRFLHCMHHETNLPSVSSRIDRDTVPRPELEGSRLC